MYLREHLDNLLYLDITLVQEIQVASYDEKSGSQCPTQSLPRFEQSTLGATEDR
jgi:hypothetical protein